MAWLTISYPDQKEEQSFVYKDVIASAQYTLIYFYPKDNTPWCTLEAQEFAWLYNQFRAVDTQIIGVSKDSHSSHCRFAQKHTLPFPLVSDPDFVFHQRPEFDAYKTKKMFGKSYKGTVRSTFVVDSSWSVVLSYPKVSPRGHAAKVLQDISWLKAS